MFAAEKLQINTWLGCPGFPEAPPPKHYDTANKQGVSCITQFCDIFLTVPHEYF